MEPVFRTLEISVGAASRALGARITYLGLENLPAHGGAVVAINHTSYVDWYPAASRSTGMVPECLIRKLTTFTSCISDLIMNRSRRPTWYAASADGYQST